MQETILSQASHEASTNQPSAESQGSQPSPSAGNSGSAASSFTIPDTFKTEKVFDGVKSYDDVFKLALEGQKMLGRGIFLPDEKDPDNVKAEKMAKVYGKLGRPEKPEEYKYEGKALLPDGMEWDKELLGKFQQTAHKHGLSQAQYNAILEEYIGLQHAQHTDPTAASREAKEALVKEWGENGFEVRMNEAWLAAKALGITEALEETGAGNNVAILKALAKIGREYREEGVIDDAVVNNLKGSADYEAQAMQIIADKNDPYNNPKHAQHRERVEHVNKLFQLAVAVG